MCKELNEGNVTVSVIRDASLRASEVVVICADRRDPTREKGIRFYCFDNGNIGAIEGDKFRNIGFALAEGEDLL